MLLQWGWHHYQLPSRLPLFLMVYHHPALGSLPLPVGTARGKHNMRFEKHTAITKKNGLHDDDDEFSGLLIEQTKVC